MTLAIGIGSPRNARMKPLFLQLSEGMAIRVMIRRLLDAYVDGQAPTRQSTRTLRDEAAQRPGRSTLGVLVVGD